MIIGGTCDDTSSSLIAKYTIDKWERVGNLQDSRYAHRAIANDNRIYVVGGWGIQYVFKWIKPYKLIYIFSETEIWSVDNQDNATTMKIAEPYLQDYAHYPELFIVDSDFCVKK